MKERLKRALIVIFASLLCIGMVACTKKPLPPSTDSSEALDSQPADGSTLPVEIGTGKKLGLITPIGGLGDGAIADACYEAFIEAKDMWGFEFDYSEPMSPQDFEAMIIEYAESGEYDLIFLAGNDGLDPVNAVGPDYPTQKFIVYDIEAAGNNQYISEYFAKHEIGFVAGVLAALMEEEGEVTIAGKTTKFDTTGKIGLIIGNEVPSTVTALTGAAAGIMYINPNYQYLYGIVGNWQDQAKNKELALSMYDQGAHFIFQNAGGGAMGIIAAAQARNLFFIGYDTDQTKWDPERVIGSSRKQNTSTIHRVLKQFLETGELAWGTAEENNAANDGIGFNFNPDLEVPDRVLKIIDQVIDDLKNNRISIPMTWEEVDQFNAVFKR